MPAMTTHRTAATRSMPSCGMPPTASIPFPALSPRRTLGNLLHAASILALCLLVACARPDRTAAAPGTPSAPPAPAATAESSTAQPSTTQQSMEPAPTSPAAATREVATLGAGCFWCIEAVLLRVDGVHAAVSGYIGGAITNPTYEQICTGQTGHAEVVRVEFDPARLSYARLLEIFFALHDPTTLNRQGNDIGTQYRSAIYYHSEAQRETAFQAILRAQVDHRQPIVTEVTAAPQFWPAEDYHQDYFRKNPDNRYCRVMIPPKLKKLGL